MENNNSFMDTVTTEATSTSYIPIPEGVWSAFISKVDARTPKTSTILEVTWVITDQDVISEMGQPEPKVTQSIFLDMTEQGFIAGGRGKNVQLGLLREAVSQNQNGQPWSPQMLVGQSALVQVVHDMYNDQVRGKVKAVTRLS